MRSFGGLYTNRNFRCSRKALLSLALSSAFIILLGVGHANAELPLPPKMPLPPPPLPPNLAPPPPPPTASVSAPKPPDCSKVTLTSEKFLKAYKAIAMHGDLSDIRFIEKTLQIKFRDGYGSDHKRIPAIDTLMLVSDTLWNSPIKVTLNIKDDPYQMVNYKAFLRFEDTSWRFMHDCLHISNEKFAGTFGGEFIRDREYYPTGPTKSKEIAGVGKDNAIVFASYSYLNDGLVNAAFIKQLPPPPPPEPADAAGYLDAAKKALREKHYSEAASLSNKAYFKARNEQNEFYKSHLLLPVGWQYDDEEERTIRRSILLGADELLAFRSYKRAGIKVAVFINFPHEVPLGTLERTEEFLKSRNDEVLQVKGFQAYYHEFANAGKQTRNAHELQIQLGEHTYMFIMSNDMPKQDMIAFANTFDLSSFKKMQ